MWERRVLYRVLWGNLRERDRLQEADRDKGIILRWILRQWDVREWT
jgi:hypothetical protein